MSDDHCPWSKLSQFHPQSASVSVVASGGGVSDTSGRLKNTFDTLSTCDTLIYLHDSHTLFVLVYYEEIKRELHRIRIYECRCDERLGVKTEGSTRLTYG